MLLVLGAIIILIIYPVLPSAKLYSAMLQSKRVPGAMACYIAKQAHESTMKEDKQCHAIIQSLSFFMSGYLDVTYSYVSR